jgi:hypothetical protein
MDRLESRGGDELRLRGALIAGLAMEVDWYPYLPCLNSRRKVHL